MYSPQLLSHFEHPRHVGEIANPDAVVELENPACGDILRLTVRMECSHIVEIGFRAKGCVPAMACASAMAEMLLGKSLLEIADIREQDILVAVGGVPSASGHAVHLAIAAVTQLLRQLQP